MRVCTLLCLNSFFAISSQNVTVMNTHAHTYIYIHIYIVGNCCLSLYFNIAGLRQGHGMLLGSWKVLEFFVTKRAGTVLILNVVRFLVSSRD